MRSDLVALGLDRFPQYERIARAFIKGARAAGISQDDAKAVVARMVGLAQEKPTAGPAEFIEAFRGIAAQRNFPTEAIDAVLDFHGHVSDVGPENISPLPAPSREEDEKRKIEIQEAMRSGEYHRDENMRLEFHDILERLGTDGTRDPSNFTRGSYSERPQNPNRLEEIEQIMSNPARAHEYWTGPGGEAMRSEYRALLTKNETASTQTPETTGNEGNTTNETAQLD